MTYIFRIKTIVGLLFSLIILLLSPAYSMAQLKVSVVAGLNNNKISLSTFYSDVSNYDTGVTTHSQMQSRYSFFGGLRVEQDLTSSLSISSGLVLDNAEYTQNIQQTRGNGSLASRNSVNGRDIVQLLYLSLPLRLIFYAPLEKTRLYVGVGGYLSYGIQGTNKFELSSTTIPSVTDSIGAITFSSNSEIKYASYHANRIDFGLSATAGIELRNNLFFELGFNGGLRTVFTDRYLVLSGNNEILYDFPNKKSELFLCIGYRIR